MDADKIVSKDPLDGLPESALTVPRVLGASSPAPPFLIVIPASVLVFQSVPVPSYLRGEIIEELGQRVGIWR